MSKRKLLFALLAVAGLCFSTISCGGGGGGGTVQNPPPISVTVSPNPVTVTSGLTQQFKATVNNSTNQNVTWSVNPTSFGTITTDGLFTPTVVSVQTNGKVVATSQADPSKSGSSNVTVNPPAVTNITLVLGSTSIQVNATTPCTPTVTYTDHSTDHNATCASDNTSVASVANNVVTGVSAGTANITASAGGVTSSPVQITVTAVQQAAVISSATPQIFPCNDEHLSCGTILVKLGGLNFTPDCTVSISPGGDALSYSSYVSATEIDLHLQFDTPSYNPGQFVVRACNQSQQTISNPFTIGFMSNRNELAVDPTTGDVFLNDAVALTVYHFNAKGVLQETFPGASRAMAADDKTQELVFVSYDQKGISSEAEFGNCHGSGFRGCGAGNYDGFMLGVVAKSGETCAFEPSPTNRLLCFNLVTDPNFQSPFTYTLLQDPCAAAMVQNGSELDLLAWNCGTNTLSRISVPDMTLKGALVLDGITPATAGTTLVQVVALSSGAVAVMSPIDGNLSLVDLDSMTQIGNAVPLDGYPDGIVANEKANQFEVTFASSPQAVPTGAELVSPTGGNPTKLNLSSPNLPLGLAVSTDGKTLYVGDRTGSLDVESNK